MGKKLRLKIRLPVLAILAIVFTLALMITTYALSGTLDRILRGYFPDIYWDFERIEVVMNGVRPIGYACLVVVIALIFVGFLTERRHFAFLGSFAFFLPTFGYFATYMFFFLTGIGILRVMWLPLLDLSPTLLKLGDVSYLPLWIVMYPWILQDVHVWHAIPLLANLIIFAGLLIFCIGTLTWLNGKFEKKKVIDFWIYKYSRHPQYLGFILLSYGIMLFASTASRYRGGPPEPSFPWLISTLLVICIALTEEIKMIKQADEQYLKYRRNTPFMLPLPPFLSELFTAPNRILLKKAFPENGREVLYTFIIYCTILVLLSILTQKLNLFEGMIYS